MEHDMCNGKRRYASETEAKHVRNVREHGSSELRIYFCDWCFGYHLTKMWKEKQRTEKVWKRKNYG